MFNHVVSTIELSVVSTIFFVQDIFSQCTKSDNKDVIGNSKK